MPYRNSQLRGALLEEVILFLLHKSGYLPVLEKNGDPTLNDGSSGLEVRGRGTWHQIDAIADFKVPPPFGNPQRLLLEAKFYGGKVGLPVIRGSAGVLKDVSENWAVEENTRKALAKKRFHYLYAIFSASAFTEPAQDYAYAHDIFLLPLRRSRFFLPIIEAIDQVDTLGIQNPPELKFIRSYIRRELFSLHYQDQIHINSILRESIDNAIGACRQLGFAFIAMFGGQFPTFLVPSRWNNCTGPFRTASLRENLVA